jgi:hypothetical protein
MTLYTVIIEAGWHDRHECPVVFRLPEPLPPGPWCLAAEDGTRLDLQAGEDGQVRCVVPELPAGGARTFQVEQGPSSTDHHHVELSEAGGVLEISLDNLLVTRYVYSDVPARPYFYPLNAPGQVPVTRAYPMVPDAEGETRDHPHHRSLWIAHGEVNDADNWSEAAGHARTRHVRFDGITGGPVAGSFSSDSLWTRSDGSPLLIQRLHVTAWATDGDLRLLDFDVELRASHGDVHFGDTKEGGILSVRVASEIDVLRTGRITNVYGGIDEAETWGKAAHWCDYSGMVGGQAAGIAVLDHPHSFRYPTHWHVRNYGLMTANPFGYAAYTGGLKDGSHTLHSGEALSFRYRVVLHRYGCEQARIGARYLDFVAPPGVKVTG